jgi:hypothetical protein
VRRVRVLAFSLLCACAPEPALSTSLAADAGGPPAITLRDVKFVHSRGSTVFAEGHVAAMTYVRESGDTLASEATVRFPRDERPGTAVDISTPRASGNPLEGKVIGEGGVHFENQQGDRGGTESATYEGKRGLAWGDSPVQLFGPGFELQSPGFHWRQSDDLLDLGRSAVVTRGRAK